MDVLGYRQLAAQVSGWEPNPFTCYPEGAWEKLAFPKVLDGVISLLTRFDQGSVTEQQLLRGKDNDKRPGTNGIPLCQDTLSHWLYFQHHKGDERWKLLGQRYWSVSAYISWRTQFNQLPTNQRTNRNDGLYSVKTFPKGGGAGLVSEHVVPKKEMKKLLVGTRDAAQIKAILGLNLCCVVTGDEDRRLQRDCHPDPMQPWLRYRGKGITVLHNPEWEDLEIEALLRHGLLSERSVAPFQT